MRANVANLPVQTTPMAASPISDDDSGKGLIESAQEPGRVSGTLDDGVQPSLTPRTRHVGAKPTLRMASPRWLFHRHDQVVIASCAYRRDRRAYLCSSNRAVSRAHRIIETAGDPINVASDKMPAVRDLERRRHRRWRGRDE